MLSEEKEARRGQYKLLLTILALIFVTITAYTIFWEIRYHQKYNYFQRVEAEVSGFDTDDNGDQYAIINYYVNDNKYEKNTDIFLDKKVGDKILVYYDINDPYGVIYSLDYRRYLLPIISGVLGGVFVVFLIMYKSSYPKQKIKQKRQTPAEMLLEE